VAREREEARAAEEDVSPASRNFSRLLAREMTLLCRRTYEVMIVELMRSRFNDIKKPKAT
jgi:hypothetical protein